MNFAVVIYILGWILSIEACLLLVPIICALVYAETQGYIYLILALVTGAIGALLVLNKPKDTQFFAKEGFVSVGLGWILLSMVGAVPFVLTGEIPSFIDALFETVSGFTTTGSSILNDVESLCRCSTMWRSFTHWIGGMGVFVFLLSVFPMMGSYNMHLMQAESPGPSVGKLVPRMRDSAKILYTIYIVLTLAMFLIQLPFGMPVFDSICNSFATAGTGGFGIKSDSMNSYSPAIQWITTIFMIIFGVNFNFYYYLLGKNKKLVFKMEDVRWYFIIIASAITLIVINVRHMFISFEDTLRNVSFSVASVITTTGYGTSDFDLWPSFSKTILVFLMFIGACAGSTGGGIKVSRFIIMFKVVRQEIVSFIHPRSVKVITMDGKALDKNVTKSVIVFISLYVFVFAASLIIITLDGFDMTTNFTAVAATLNNIGPGLNAVGPTQNFAGFSDISKVIFIFDMLAGRLELFPILVLFSPSLWKKRSK